MILTFEKNLPPYEVIDFTQIDQAMIDEIEDLYLSIHPEFEERIDKLIKEQAKTEVKPPQTQPTISVKLPEMSLETFSGDYMQWQVFINAFDSLIDKNQSISKSTKFQYLRRSLKGAALQVIESLDVNEENYDRARDLLKDRFEKETFICEQHIKSLFTFKLIDRPCPRRIMELIDHFKSHLRSLQSLGRPTEKWDDLIIYLILTKVDNETKAKWVDAAPTGHLPTLEELYVFLRNRVYKLESQPSNSNSSPSNPKGQTQPIPKFNFKKPRNTVLTGAKPNTAYNCCHCSKSGHTIVRCMKFLSLPIDDRVKFVASSKICKNCLRIDHDFESCPVVQRCRHCNQAHHSILHDSHESPSNLPTTVTNSNSTSRSPNTQSSTVSASLTMNKPPSTNNYVFLATAQVQVMSHSGYPIMGRALLDSGSQVNLMTESFRSKLNISSTNSDLPIHCIGNNTTSARTRAKINLSSRVTNFSSKIDVHILPKITGYQPSVSVTNIKEWNLPKNIELADPTFYIPQSIDLLLGAEIFPKLLSVGQIKLDDNLPILQNSLLGWIVSGKSTDSTEYNPHCHFLADDSSDALHKDFERFWMIENPPNSTKRSTEEEICENYFVESTTRNDEGRFVVKLPMKSEISLLGDSREMATKRFFNLERRLQKSPELSKMYSEFMSEYHALGHMSPIDDNAITSPNYILPHHCVFKADSSTTKLRVVFDGSAKTTAGNSLNEFLRVGPTVQNDLFSILVRFRCHEYVFSADITKMYRQVLIHPDDRRYQMILWRNSVNDPLQTFQLNTVTYGTSSAPFLATRCLYQLAAENRLNFHRASIAIEKDIYVDDLLTGASSIQEAISLRSQIDAILNSAGMVLRKWCANATDIIDDIPPADREKIVKIDDTDVVKTLGILWQPDADTFTFSINLDTASKNISKRTIFSQVARIFDPLGFLSPIVVSGKLIIQSLWKLRLDWDQSIPQDLHYQWLQYRDNLPQLNRFSIDRKLLVSDSNRSTQIHGFADASERAYGAVLYVRSVSKSGEIMVKFLCSRSRVAPLKSITLPRLELCAASLLAELTQTVTKVVNFQVDEFFFWSDSTIALQWIKACPSKWKTFVRNRVSQIQDATNKDSWFHVSSEQNPADLVSRGTTPEKLISSSLWHNGPDFLRSKPDSWPIYISHVEHHEEKLPEQNTVATIITPEEDTITNIKFHSNFMKLLRVIAYMLRFQPNSTHRGVIKIHELERAHATVVRLVQRQCFPDEYFGLMNASYVVRNSALKSLCLFIDDENIIRVGGRLHHSALPYQSKHPILLPHNHILTNTILIYYHRKLLHVGPQALLAAVRELYWPINGRRLCAKVFRECIRCFRARPTPLKQLMGNLPAERVTPSFPFHSIGVDYCGPFMTHYHIRGKRPTKAYVCVFMCFTTKGIHLETASDMTTDAFMGAFKRFIAARGVPRYVYSDNGRNFVGANSQLHELYDMLASKNLNDDLHSYCVQNRIIWKFAPPFSPNFGGLHETGVKLTKFHLRRVMGNEKFTYEQLNTVIKEIEAILNSRPITPVSSSPDDLNCLTPGHALIGRPMTSLPSDNLTDSAPLQTWKRMEYVRQCFWSRWSTEYIRAQQHRYQWTDQKPNLAVNDLVILIEDNLPPLKWKLGRILEIYPGEDGLVRVAKVKTEQGEYKRAISKLAKLPMSVETTSTFQGAEHDDDQTK